MGPPIKVMLGDRMVFVCCDACIEELKANPDKYLAKIDAATTANTEATPAPEEPAKDERAEGGLSHLPKARSHANASHVVSFSPRPVAGG